MSRCSLAFDRVPLRKTPFNSDGWVPWDWRDFKYAVAHGEVAAVTGQSREMIQHYSIMVNQRRLARSAILRWEGSKNG